MAVIHNLIHLLAPLTANCRDFHQRWERARSLDAGGISGCWEGEWISAASGHHGPLRCVIDPLAPALWQMHFRAGYAKLFRACYSTAFNVVQEAGRWRFSGGSDLGPLAGGAYEYQGSATLEALTCSYKSARDHGTFVLAHVNSQPPNDQLPRNSV